MAERTEQGYSNGKFSIEYDESGFCVRDSKNHVIVDGSCLFKDGFIILEKFQEVKVDMSNEAKVLWDDIELNE